MSEPSSNNSIESLRDELFKTIRGVRNKSIDLDAAKAVGELAQVIINSAKVEVDFVRATGQNTDTGFIPRPQLPGTKLIGGK